MRVGVFGGTFDPIHLGHLMTAEQARETARLDAVWFVPAASPPNKQGQQIAPFDRRVEMVRLAIAGREEFAVDELERERPGPSFTVDTLTELHRRHPGHEWFLIVGSDCLSDLPGWYQPARLLELASLIVVGRPGFAMRSVEQLRSDLQLPAEARLELIPVEMPMVEIASRDLRRRLSEGRSVRYLIPRAVEAYIHEKRLYQAG